MQLLINLYNFYMINSEIWRNLGCSFKEFKINLKESSGKNVQEATQFLSVLKQMKALILLEQMFLFK